MPGGAERAEWDRQDDKHEIISGPFLTISNILILIVHKRGKQKGRCFRVQLLNLWMVLISDISV